MRNRFRQLLFARSFRSKLMLASLACILLPAFVTLGLYNQLTQEAVKRQAIANAQQSLLLVNGYVSNLMKYMLNIANYIQMDSEINTILKMRAAGQSYDGADAEYQKFTDESKIMSRLDNITMVGDKCYVTILLANGAYYTNYPISEYNPSEMTKEPWFANLQNLNGFQSYWIGSTPTVFRSEQRNNPYQISVARTLRGEGLNIYGYVVVTILENEMNRMFQNLADGEEMMLLDDSGLILSDRDTSRIGQPFLPLRQMKEGSASDIIKIGADNYLIARQTLTYNGWNLVSLIPYKKATVNIQSIFDKVFVLQLVSFFVFFLLLLYLLRKFTRPLVHLGKVAATVQRGNLEVRSGIRGQDEIGRLASSFDQMLDRIREMIEEVSLTQARKRKAELAMLQAQINPHFLFNVLNSIRMKVMRRGDRESAEMIGSLSKLLRMTIHRDQEKISLHEEIETVMDYVQLMNMRKKEAVELDVEVSSDALMEKVPRFFLQPVIENALIHGLNQGAGCISLRAEAAGGELVVAVADNGAGMDRETLLALRKFVSGEEREAAEPGTGGSFSGIGLPNVCERMRMTYGDAFRMDIDSEPGKGTRITMFIPRQEVESSDVQRHAGG